MKKMILKNKELLEGIFIFIVLTSAIGSAVIMTIKTLREISIGVWWTALILIVGSIVLTIGLGKYTKNKNVEKIRQELSWVFWAGLTLVSILLVCIVLMVVSAILRELGVITI